MKMNIKVENDIYEVDIQDLDVRPILAKVGDQVFEIWPVEEDEDRSKVSIQNQVSPQLAQKPIVSTVNGAQNASEAANNALKSPLPGVISKISVKKHDAVNPGQEVMRLEAMKMVNVIRATVSGTVAEIHVSEGQQVKHGDTLITFEIKD